MTAASIRNIIYDFDLNNIDPPERKYEAFERACKNSSYVYELRKSGESEEPVKSKNKKARK